MPRFALILFCIGVTFGASYSFGGCVEILSLLNSYQPIHPIDLVRHHTREYRPSVRRHFNGLVDLARLLGKGEVSKPDFEIKGHWRPPGNHGYSILSDSKGRHYLVVSGEKLVLISNEVGDVAVLSKATFGSMPLKLPDPMLTGSEQFDGAVKKLEQAYEKRQRQKFHARQTVRALPMALFYPALKPFEAFYDRFKAKRRLEASLGRRSFLQRDLGMILLYSSLMASGLHPNDLMTADAFETLQEQEENYPTVAEMMNKIKLPPGGRKEEQTVLVINGNQRPRDFIISGTLLEQANKIFGEDAKIEVADAPTVSAGLLNVLRAYVRNPAGFNRIVVGAHGDSTDIAGLTFGEDLVTVKKLEPLPPGLHSVPVDWIPEIKGMLKPGGQIVYVSCKVGRGDCGKDLITRVTQKLSDEETKAVISTELVIAPIEEWPKEMRDNSGLIFPPAGQRLEEGEPGFDFPQFIQRHMGLPASTAASFFFWASTKTEPKNPEPRILTLTVPKRDN